MARQRKTIIAEAVGCDIADLEAYQPGRHRPPLYTAGDYFIAIRPGEKLPDGYEWKPIEVWRKDDAGNGWTVYRSN